MRRNTPPIYELTCGVDAAAPIPLSSILVFDLELASVPPSLSYNGMWTVLNYTEAV
ncbi:hypothetical protein P186_2297 [Pyrobaculum ferrireducens]|uniref:Uncharacterized protein n=1 Tax=Pyrobaculum ferrireducens TaxID=1104324 RepID=G7VBS2_9CREN|nr:hypothetical protein P186_2297 [Pyrobaculum ferrireducens]